VHGGGDDGAAARRLAVGIAALAVLVYAGALANGFAWDDVPLVEDNSLVHRASGLWRAFALPYWPPPRGGQLYRPLVMATYTLDWLIAPWRAWWLHGVNLAWHAAASATVALLARRWAGASAGWIAGSLFAVHPVHVEAVANIVGRAELLAALCAMLAVWLALERDNLAGSAIAWTVGLLSKENAVVVPALVGAAWLLGWRRPPAGGRRIAAYVGVWCAIGVAYLALRFQVFHAQQVTAGVAIVFLGQSPLTVRLTGVAALADVTRLLVFPLHLRADYSPMERTAVTSPVDPRFLAGLGCLLLWGGLVWLLWRRGRRVEAFGIAWIGVALAPVANLAFPVGVLLAERTLYLPSVGLVLAVGTALASWRAGADARARQWADAAVALAVVAGGARTALRVPVWESTSTVYQSVIRDSPRSYFGPAIAAGYAQAEGRFDDALEAYRRAARILPTDNRLSLHAAEVAYRLGRFALVDTLVAHMDSTCAHCETFYKAAALEARWRGRTAWSDWLLRHLAAQLAAHRS
jgi:hypothetical protein